MNGDDSKYTGNPEGDRFSKLDGAEYDRVSEFLKDRTNLTPREWAIARLCDDFKMEDGRVEMTTIGENLPELVPFMTDVYSAQSVNSAKARFDEKVQMAANTFYYGALCGFYTADEFDDILYEARETAQLMLETEGAEVDFGDTIEIDDTIADAAKELHAASAEVRSTLDEERDG